MIDLTNLTHDIASQKIHDEHLKPIKHIFNDKSKYYLNFLQYIIENIHRKNNSMQLIREYDLRSNETMINLQHNSYKQTTYLFKVT